MHAVRTSRKSVWQPSTDHKPGSVVAYKDPYYGKTGAVIPGRRNVSKRRMQGNGEITGKWDGERIPENKPAVNNSGNDRISK